jgi:hypothetical protein
MSVRLKAIYRDGAFVPVSNGERLNVRENSEVEITVHDPYVIPPRVTDEAERGRIMQELIEGWRQHPLRGDAPRLTRDELHERR